MKYSVRVATLKIKRVDLMMLVSKCVETIKDRNLYPRPMLNVDALDKWYPDDDQDGPHPWTSGWSKEDAGRISMIQSEFLRKLIVLINLPFGKVHTFQLAIGVYLYPHGLNVIGTVGAPCVLWEGHAQSIPARDSFRTIEILVIFVYTIAVAPPWSIIIAFVVRIAAFCTDAVWIGRMLTI